MVEPRLDFFVATVIIESSTEYNNQLSCETFNQLRCKTLMKILIDLLEKVTNNYKSGVIIFPAGMFYTENDPPNSKYEQICKKICLLLKENENHIVVCFGIDGSNGRDQIAVAVDRTGIIALGRKFYPTKKEKENGINIAENFNCLENGKSRIFKFGNSLFYLGVCYDVFGIKKLETENNPEISGFIELVHCFYPKYQKEKILSGESYPSGESYFARHGFAGTAYKWNCTVYGTAVFFDRKVPEYWPTGVKNQVSNKTKTWKYSDNPLKPIAVEQIDIDEGKAVVRLFPMP
jgi:hypothetical protein